MKLAASLVMLLIWILQSTPAVEPAQGLAWAPGAGQNRTRRGIACRDNLEYLHSGICCLYCPAGTYVKQHCTKASQRGVCESCDFGLYTEHENGLSECLQCTKCRSDQDLVEQCSSTTNSQCQCKKGYFCLPDQACEVCKTCSKCGEDEEVAVSCTSSSNTVCKKRGFSRASTAAIVFAVLAPAVIVLVAVLYWKAPGCSKTALAALWPRGVLQKDSTRCSVEDGHNELNAALEDSGPSQPFIVKSQPDSEGSRRLVPLNGEESLKRSFDLFEEMDVNYHSRFFRYIGLSDNAIRNAESLSLEDRVYGLLKVWLEKEGMRADLNTLIEALLHFNQRLSAENITARAVSSGHYRYEDAE
ncbi:hematopoietic death receptor isoform X2 [Salminus brasiliensis]|uniref:hematopoietic death receptor isoform X2 n=1 Tax=Salminus brasiliensis TaxID=930266 RepID=UPI003B82DD00